MAKSKKSAGELGLLARFQSWLSSLFRRIVVLLAVFAGLALYFTPDRIATSTLEFLLSRQGLTPYTFEVVDASFTHVEVVDIGLGTDAEFSLGRARLEFRWPGVLFGFLDRIEFEGGHVIGRQRGQGFSFGVLDGMLFPNKPRGVFGGSFLSADLSLEDMQFSLRDGQRVLFEAVWAADLNADGTSDIRLRAETPVVEEGVLKPLEADAYFTRNEADQVVAHIDMSLNDLVLLDYRLGEGALKVHYEGESGKGSGAIDVGASSLELPQALVDDALRRLNLSGALPEGVKFSLRGDMTLAHVDDQFVLTFVNPLTFQDQSPTGADALLKFELFDSALGEQGALTLGSFFDQEVRTHLAYRQSGTASPDFQIDVDGHVAFKDKLITYHPYKDECLKVTGDYLEFPVFDLREANVSFCAADRKPLLEINRIKGGLGLARFYTTMPAQQMSILAAKSVWYEGAFPEVNLSGTFDLGNGTWQSKIQSRKGDLLVSKEDSRLQNIVFDGNAVGIKTQIESVNGQLKSMDVVDPKPEDVFAPLIVTGNLTSNDRVVDIRGGAKLRDGVEVALIEGQHDLRDHSGVLNIKDAGLSFAPGSLQPPDLFPLFSTLMEKASGSMAFEGMVGWKEGRVTSSGEVTLSDINFDSLVGPVAGMNGTVSLGSLLPIATLTPQTLSIDLIDVGLELTEGKMAISQIADGDLVLESAVWPWSGGEIGLERSVLIFDDTDQELTLFADDVNLEEVFLLLDVSGLTGTGTLEGRIPVVLEEEGARIVDARLKTKGQGGELSYIGAASETGGQDEGSELLFDALEDFKYDSLEVDLNGMTAGSLYVAIRLQGMNPNVMGGYPIKLNVATEGPLLEMIRQGTVGARISQEIEQKVGQ